MNNRKKKVKGFRVVAMNLAFGLGVLAVALLIMDKPKTMAYSVGYVLTWVALVSLIVGIVLGAIHAGMKTSSGED